MDRSYWEFWINAENKKGCWEWTKSRTEFGYGHYCIGGKVLLAHRYAYLISNGEIPKGLSVLHRCDNPPCVNPKHLYAGTAKDNAQDRKNRNRQSSRVGNSNGRSKLNEDKVLTIREKFKNGERTQKELSLENNVTPSTIHSIIKRRIWSHI
jgi:hypothetical protein